MNQSDRETELNRRDFLKGGSLAAMMTMLGGVPLLAEPAPGPAAESNTARPKVKCAVIGLGAWGREILDNLGLVLKDDLAEAEIAAICDSYPASLRRGATKAPSAAQTADYKTILDNKDIKAVIVATPTHLHKEIVLAALQAGKHVYCEAPLAHTIEDAREIARAAKKASKLVFQSGLQMRCDPERRFLQPFIRSEALGELAMARAQWHKKQSWRSASSNPEHEKALNWRLDKTISPGLAGEIGIHQLDQAGWFLNSRPVSVTGLGRIAQWNDGREVADTIQVLLEFQNGVRLNYDCTLANSFDADYEVYFGSFAAVMIRQNKAWIFKEVDSPLLGWEVYGRKETFHKETGIALMANATKLNAQGAKGAAEASVIPPLHDALVTFLRNTAEIASKTEEFISLYGADDPTALAKELSTVHLEPAPGFLEGYRATVTGLKTNEAITTGQKIVFQPDWFELS